MPDPPRGYDTIATVTSKALRVTNAAGDVIVEYSDFDPGQPVSVAAARDGSNVAAASDGWVFRGPSRHPRYAVITDTRFGTVIEVERERLTPR